MKKKNKRQRTEPEPEPVIVVCQNADAPLATRDATYDHFCKRCNQRVMMAPSGQRFLKEHTGVEIICFKCYRRSDDWGGPFLSADPETVAAECATAIPNPFRTRN